MSKQPAVEIGRAHGIGAPRGLAARLSPDDRASVIATVFLIVALLFGGGPTEVTEGFYVIVACGLAILAAAAFGGGMAAFRATPILFQLAVLLWLLLPILQLVPLPPSIWHALPGHELRVETLTTFGLGQSWTGLTSDIVATAITAAIAISMFGYLATILSMSDRQVKALLCAFLVILGLGVAVGLFQVASNGLVLKLHRQVHSGALIGFYANKNHMGFALACGILVAYAIFRNRLRHSSAGARGMIFATVIALALLFATNSRAGVLLGFLALFAVFSDRFRSRIPQMLLLCVGSVATFLLAAYFIPTVGDLVGRFGGSAQDVRVDFTRWVMPLADRYWLVGSGFGTFRDIFAVSERLEWVKPTYLNAAHNDYVQLLIEAGVAGVVALALLTGAVLTASIHLVRGTGPFTDPKLAQYAWMGLGIVGFAAAHSLVDYPLRRIGTLIIFITGLALLMRPWAQAGKLVRYRT